MDCQLLREDRTLTQRLSLLILSLGLGLHPHPVSAVEDQIELETTRIITNEELPGLLYLVPWKDTVTQNTDSPKLVLHNFFGDLYEPVLPPFGQHLDAQPQ